MVLFREVEKLPGVLVREVEWLPEVLRGLARVRDLQALRVVEHEHALHQHVVPHGPGAGFNVEGLRSRVLG